jgi:beta-ribofuranosylaminobenzene 5'-phosphate synthase
MATSVTVTTGARLHFGPLAASGSSGGKFGGVGMMVSSPGYIVSAQDASVEAFLGDAATCRRAEDFVRTVRLAMNEDPRAALVRMEIREVIPSHAGLGSGTQLGLAVACALSQLRGEREVPVEVLATRAGRGLRSAIGLHGFAQGGFLVDGGRAGSGQLGTLVSRIEFPADWRLILAAPPELAGLSGAAELNAFASQPPMPQSLTAELCRIALMEWLPGLIDVDFARVSHAMYDFGLQVGRFFEPVQGGVFASPAMSRLADEVHRRGFPGVAQTSWGPTLCILCENESSAQELRADLSADSRWSDCKLQVTAPLNSGASVTA